MLRIVMDGAGDMPAGWGQQYGIHILPLNVQFGEQTFTQGKGFTLEDFYRMVREKRMIPKTSLPSIGQIKDFYRSIAQQGDTILSIHISSKLSGTYNTVKAAASELAGEFNIIVFDSLAGSAAQAFMAREARIMAQAGAGMDEIVRRLEIIRQRITIIFTLDSLEFAVLSGRISALKSVVATALQLKPIILLRDGLLDVADRVRTRTRALDHILAMAHQRLDGCQIHLAIVHAADSQTAQKILERVRGLFPVQECFVTDLSIPVAANLGPGAIGIVAYPIDEAAGVVENPFNSIEKEP